MQRTAPATPPSQETPPTAPPPAKTRRLYRSRTDRMVGGVCGGLAAYLGVDPTIVRLLFLASVFLPGPQVIAYIVAWIVVPPEAAHRAELSAPR